MIRIPRIAVLLVIAALHFSFDYVAENFAAGKRAKLVYTVEAAGNNDSTLVQQIYSERLVNAGLEKKDVRVNGSGNKFTVVIANYSSYEPSVIAEAEKMLVMKGQLGFWETYEVSEAGKSLVNSLISGPDTLTDEFFALFTWINNEGRGPVFGKMPVTDTAKAERLLDRSRASGKLPPQIVFAWSNAKTEDDAVYCELVMLKSAPGGKASMDGPLLTDARVIMNQTFSIPEISISMAKEDAERWRDLTKKNVGRSISLVIDGVVYSSPTVQNEIPGGVSSITGNFTVPEATALVTLLKSRPIPYDMRITEKTVIN